MNCQDVDILLQLAADGEVTEAEQNALDLHLDGCVGCRRKEAWLEVLDQQLEVAFASEIGNLSLADGVVAALGSPRGVLESYEPSHSSTKPSSSGRKKGKKGGLLRRAISIIWNRRKAKRAKEQARIEQERSGWIASSVSALQLPPTSLAGFRAAKGGVSSAVSGPVKAVRWVTGK